MSHDPNMVEVAAASQTKKPRSPLRRPRGKRGGIKNRKPTSSSTSSSKSGVASGQVGLSHTQRIARFHTLEKELARTEDEGKRRQLLREQEKLGGLKAYQDASLFGGDRQRGGETGKWSAQALAEALGSQDPIRLLDVGALSGSSYEKSGWISTTSIDINPRSDAVLKYDFFDYPRPAAEQERFDVVALSLVLNFVGDLGDRGRMLVHAHDYVKRQGGYLFVALPLACVDNSRYLDHARFRAILASCGWSVVRQDDSARLTRWLCRQESKSWDGVEWKKKEIKKGVKLNNFCIVVR
jgi:25S rRNA (adenine2142-N1)-methyltransferase